MKRNNNDNVKMAIVTVNTVILMLLILNETYKPIIEKLAIEYKKLKKEFQRKNNQKTSRDLTMHMLEKAKKELPSTEVLLSEALTEKDIQSEIKKCEIISKEVKMYLTETVKNLNFDMITSQQNYPRLAYAYPVAEVIEYPRYREIEASIFNSPKLFFQSLCLSIAILISVNTCEKAIENMSYANEKLISDIEDFVKYVVPMSNKANGAGRYNEMNVLEQESSVEKTLPYNEFFDKLLMFEGKSFEETLLEISNSKITSYNNIFDYILDSKIIAERLQKPEKMKYIVDSYIANDDEKFAFLKARDDLTIQDKVWYTFMFPSMTLDRALEILFDTENLEDEEIINCIINNDIFTFTTLFDALDKRGVLNSDNLANYLKYYYYNTSYNTVSMEELMSYIMHYNVFTSKEKINCLWEFLNTYSLEEKEGLVSNYFGIEYRDYLNIYELDINLGENQEAIIEFYNKIAEEKEAYILAHYEIESKQELNAVIAGCAAEGAYSYNDLYWIANTIFNRITNPAYAKHGKNPFNQFIAPGQFSVYPSGAYLLYLNPNNVVYHRKYLIAKQALYDMLYASYDGISHNYLEFRSWGSVGYSNNYVVNGGNRYGGEMLESNRILYDDLLETEEEYYVGMSRERLIK